LLAATGGDGQQLRHRQRLVPPHDGVTHQFQAARDVAQRIAQVVDHHIGQVVVHPFRRYALGDVPHDDHCGTGCRPLSPTLPRLDL